jgi:hypothetical protein
VLMELLLSSMPQRFLHSIGFAAGGASQAGACS